MKFVKRMMLSLMAILVIGTIGIGSMKLSVRASEQLSGSFKTVSEEVTVYASKNTSGDAVATINVGDTVLVISEDTQWAEVMYQGESGFIYTNGKSVFTDLENTAAGDELEKRAQTDKSWIESYIAQMKAIRSARIWRIAIIALVVVVITLIVVKSIKQNIKNDDNSSNTQE